MPRLSDSTIGLALTIYIDKDSTKMADLPNDGTVRGDDSSSLTIGHGTEDVLNHASEQLAAWPLRENGPNVTLGVQSAPTPNNTSAETSNARSSLDNGPDVTDSHTTNYVMRIDAAQEVGEASTTQVQDNNDNHPRSSFEIMGCLTPNLGTNQLQPVRGVGPTLSRPPSSMPDFGFVGQNNAPSEPAVQVAADLLDEHRTSPIIQFSIALFFFFTAGFSTTAAGVLKTVYEQADRPFTTGHEAWLGLSIFFFVFSSAGLGFVLFRSPEVLAEIPRRARALPWGVHWPRLRLKRVHLPRLHWPAIKMPRPGQYGGRSLRNLPHAKELELDELENQPRRPPTPYPGTSSQVPTYSAQAFPHGHPQTLPLGFPVPPTASISRMHSGVSRVSSTSFRSDPRSVSPLSDVPPAPPPKDPGFSRFQSQQPLLPPAVSGDTVAQSDTRASILTTLCDAVQLSNPDNEQGRAAQNYSPLAMASSPATAATSRDSASIQSPKPTYPIELASPSRGKERED